MKVKIMKLGSSCKTVKKLGAGSSCPKTIESLKDIKGKAQLEKLVLRDNPQKYVRFV